MLEVAIVGLGNWGQYLVNCVQGKSRKIHFAIAVTRRPETFRDFGKRHGISITSNFDSVLHDPALSGIVLATPHSLHCEQIIAAARAGKHVFVEKPLALSARDATTAFQACSRAGVGLFVGYNWRFQPALVELVNIVKSGMIGQCLHVEGNYSGPSGFKRSSGSWRTVRDENPAGGMTGRGVHVLDAMNWLCGPVTQIFAFSDRRATPDDLDDTTSTLFRFANGVTGYIGACQVTAEFWRLHVLGTKGWVEMRMETELTLCQIDKAPEKRSFPMVVPEFFELEAFADAVMNNVFSSRAVEDAINGVACLQAIELSVHTGRCIDIEKEIETHEDSNG
jgi:predicted dehydrogenase